MTLKKNVIANYLGQIYVSLIGILVFPLYLKYLGPEAYGLVGFYIVLQSWLQILDIGFSPTLSRQVAFSRGANHGFLSLKKQLKTMEVFFYTTALVLTCVLYVSSDWIAADWLRLSTLDLKDVAYAISLIGVMISLRLIATLYKSGINGFEQQVWLNITTVFFSSLKFLGALVVLIWFSTDYVVFFEYQIVISLLEAFCFWAKMKLVLPATERVKLRIYSDEIKPLLPFALSLGYTTAVWIFLSQLDKLVLSNILTLSNYGYFTVVAILSSGLMQMSAPLGNALMPRMTHLLAQGKQDEMLQLYRDASQVMSVVIFPLTAVLVFYAKDVLYVWTGDRTAAEWGHQILSYYIVGSGLVTIVSFQYYLQYVHGKLRLFVMINTITALIYIPLILYTAYTFGPLGTAIAWLVLNSIGFAVIMPLVHRVFAKGIHKRWLVNDILPPAIMAALVAYLMTLSGIASSCTNRWLCLADLMVVGLVVLLSVSLSSSLVRKKLAQLFEKLVKQ